MSNQNFEAFKPLNEEEEKKIVGGGAQPANSCATIEQEINAIEAQLALLQRQGLPIPPGLGQELLQYQQQYQQCMANSGKPLNP